MSYATFSVAATNPTLKAPSTHFLKFREYSKITFSDPTIPHTSIAKSFTSQFPPQHNLFNFHLRVLNLLLYIRVTKFTSRVKKQVTPNSKINQFYIPFSKLAVDTVFKILDKEESEKKYGETLVIYLEQNPADNKYSEDIIIKTNAPKCLKEKMAEDTEKD